MGMGLKSFINVLYSEILNKNVQLGTSPLQQIRIKPNYYAQVYYITIIKYNRTLDLIPQPVSRHIPIHTFVQSGHSVM